MQNDTAVIDIGLAIEHLSKTKHWAHLLRFIRDIQDDYIANIELKPDMAKFYAGKANALLDLPAQFARIVEAKNEVLKSIAKDEAEAEERDDATESAGGAPGNTRNTPQTI